MSCLAIFTAKHTLFMSHGHERTEKICLNCGAHVTGRFCQDCGQENLEPKESFGHLVVHFFNDVTHFDGKFFTSLKYLLTKPGFLSEEYVKGRRATYLNPIRMYLFVSFLFFLVIFALPKSENDAIQNIPDTDSLTTNTPTLSIHAGRLIEDVHVNSLESYDSLQTALPRNKRDNFINRYITRKAIKVQEQIDSDPEYFGETFVDKVKHSAPKMFYISIPFFAFFLYLLYYKKRNEYYYVAHGIFSIHFYCAFFILLLFADLIKFIDPTVGQYVSLAMVVGAFIYLYKGMRRFYKQRRAITILKYFSLILLTFLLVAFLAISSVINAFLSAGQSH